MEVPSFSLVQGSLSYNLVGNNKKNYEINKRKFKKFLNVIGFFAFIWLKPKIIVLPALQSEEVIVLDIFSERFLKN